MKRTKIGFYKKYLKTAAALETHNRRLRELLDSNDKLDRIKASRKDTTWGTIFESIHEHADSVHTAIKKRWNCGYTKPQLAGLRLQKCLSGDDPVFSMAFNIPDELYELPTHAREVIISMKKTCQTNLELIK
jgi:hypothetical protein